MKGMDIRVGLVVKDTRPDAGEDVSYIVTDARRGDDFTVVWRCILSDGSLWGPGRWSLDSEDPYATPVDQL